MAKQRGRFGVWIDSRLCKGTEGCAICIHLCPEKVLGPAKELSPRGVHLAEVVDLDQCTGCGLCMLHCPDLALVVQARQEAAAHV